MGILSFLRPQSKLERLREERETLELELTTRHLKESAELYGSGWGSLVKPPWADERERPFYLSSSREQYTTGSAYPIFNSEQELAIIRDTARWIAAKNPYIVGVIRGLTAFIVGKGYRYLAAAKRGQVPPEELVDAVQMHIEEQSRMSAWPEMEREIFGRSVRDGEAIIRCFPRKDGYIDVRTVEPDHLVQPAGSGYPSAEWYYGVHVDPDDHFDILGYWITLTGNAIDGEEVDMEDVEHIKRNVDRIVRRGVPDLFCLQEVAEGALKLLRNMQAGGSVQAAIAFIRQHTAATKTQVETFADAHAFAKTTASNGVQTRKTRIEPGSIIDINEGQEWVDPPLASKNTQNFISIVQAALRCICTRWNAPEYLTGDASNANFASSLVAESPFVRGGEIEQEFYKAPFIRIMERSVKSGVKAGKFPENVLDLIEIQATAPTLAVRDKLQAAQENEIKFRNGIISGRTWAEQDGLDYDQEVENGAKVKETSPSPFGAFGEGREAGANLPRPFRVVRGRQA